MAAHNGIDDRPDGGDRLPDGGSSTTQPVRLAADGYARGSHQLGASPAAGSSPRPLAHAGDRAAGAPTPRSLAGTPPDAHGAGRRVTDSPTSRIGTAAEGRPDPERPTSGTSTRVEIGRPLDDPPTAPIRAVSGEPSGAAPDAGAASRRPRLDGVDAARALALAGMASVHILPVRTAAGADTVAGAIASGRASALFAVLAGVGVALSTGGPTPVGRGRPHAAAAAGLLVRGVLVALVGLTLVELEPPVAVILVYYGLLFWLATPLLRWRAPALAAAAAVWCVAGPVLSHVLRAGREAGPGDQPGFAALATPVEMLRELTVTGYYPVLPWLTYLLVGMAVGRLDLRSSKVAAGLLGGGAAVAVAAWVGSALLLGPGGGAAALGPDVTARRYGTVPTDSWWWLAVEAPHTGTPFDLAHTTGTALAVLGLMLLLARAVPMPVWPLAAVGAIPLTLYTLHVVALVLVPVKLVRAAGIPAGSLLIVHLVAAVVIGVALRAAGWRGPLEALVRVVSDRVRRAVAGGG